MENKVGGWPSGGGEERGVRGGGDKRGEGVGRVNGQAGEQAE